MKPIKNRRTRYSSMLWIDGLFECSSCGRKYTDAGCFELYKSRCPSCNALITYIDKKKEA